MYDSSRVCSLSVHVAKVVPVPVPPSSVLVLYASSWLVEAPLANRWDFSRVFLLQDAVSRNFGDNPTVDSYINRNLATREGTVCVLPQSCPVSAMEGRVKLGESVFVVVKKSWDLAEDLEICPIYVDAKPFFTSIRSTPAIFDQHSGGLVPTPLLLVSRI
ncbi:hypothetical protein SISSUDRAFT_1031568 [Sistotremastrum suecicum HHB10207 ss-3]|uniref:Uncharacterized protein n=1 Tax=Sistotremastrum suecicum HHB10207 ss-3 TaxID=1314776 RepID=A0A166FTT3_9AGAM|nr:hypothetical protein SISSUDRAFT_1031568 [Sistotremastrum suecicum HHB10207 ss-3]